MVIQQTSSLTRVLGIAFVAIGAILFLIMGTRLILAYRKSKKNQTLFLSGILLGGGMALLFLMAEQGLLLATVDPDAALIPGMKSILQYRSNEINQFWISYIFACIAYLCSGIAIMSANAFTWSFYDWRRRVLIPSAVLMISYVILVILTPFNFVYTPGDWTPEREPLIDTILLALFLPPLIVPVLLFLYLTLSYLKQRNVQWRRLFVLTLGQAGLTFGYIVEILNVQDPWISVFSRFLIMLYPLFIWIGFMTPGWAKKLLGLSR